MNEGEQLVWDAAVDEACRKVMALQDGFRKLLNSKRGEYLKHGSTMELSDLEAQISEGEAIVGVLGDVIRNIAAMKKGT